MTIYEFREVPQSSDPRLTFHEAGHGRTSGRRLVRALETTVFIGIRGADDIEIGQSGGSSIPALRHLPRGIGRW